MHLPHRKPLLGPAELPLKAKHVPSCLHKGMKSPTTFIIVAVFLCAITMYGADVKSLVKASPSSPTKSDIEVIPQHLATAKKNHKAKQTLMEQFIESRSKLKKLKKLKIKRARGRQLHPVDLPESCDLGQGEWVYDNASYPLYREDECRFLSEQVTCRKNGRPDDSYQKWRWQPKDCSLPKFDAELFLQRLRGKRFMFVGDSLNRNQWESMVCLVNPSLSEGMKWFSFEGSRSIFHALEYDATLEFYWAPFLVESNSDDPKIHSIERKIIKAESIAGHGVHWKDVDYLVFNTYVWWMDTPDMRVLRPAAEDWEQHDLVPRPEAYGNVMKTWSNWLSDNIDPARTSVFFMSISPVHITPQAWGNPGGKRCFNETEPVVNFHGRLKLGTEWEIFHLAANATRSVPRVPVTFIDVTVMSEHRKDGHTSVYTVRRGELLTPEQQAEPATYADCIHWCLPGVPDTWNLLLYARILSRPRLL